MSKKSLRFLEGYALCALVAVIGGAFGLSWLQKSVLLSGQQAAVIAAVLVDLANQDRGDQGLQGLRVSPELQAAAQAKANDMATKEYFSHTTPEGYDSWHWFQQVGYVFTHAGENLAVDFSDSVDVERAWMNSPTHRANIIDGRYTEIGIAVAQGIYQGHATMFVVQMFATPAPVQQVAIKQSSIPSEPTRMATAVTEQSPQKQVLGESIKPLQPVIGRELTSAPPTLSSENPQTTFLTRLFASPHQVLAYIYYVMAVFVLFALLITTRFEFKRHHIRHVGVASILIVLMGGLFIVAGSLLFPQPLIAKHIDALNTSARSHQ
ncbi:MAG TPA: CAP domain-containing protein [Candidatus Paceibacterota bacterium]